MFSKIKLLQGDITKVNVDAIVNAANTSLLGGGGVDGAIHRAGSPSILQECQMIRNRQGGCKVGEAVITGGGRLPAKRVIHTVGPVWNGGTQREEELLASAYQNSLRLAVEHQLKTIAFPNISTGIYHFPKDKAAAIAIAAISEFLAASDELVEVVVVCFDQENYALYEGILKRQTQS
jgi:O-acetyl-ADP-ribose deacetylase